VKIKFNDYMGRVGITASTFDLLHAGHVMMLSECKKHCDFLICALQNDPSVDRDTKNAPVQSLVERQIQLAACTFVDDIVVYNTERDLADIMIALPIDVRILGVEYVGKDFTGKRECDKKNIEIIYNSRDHSFSTTQLRTRVLERERERISNLKEY